MKRYISLSILLLCSAPLQAVDLFKGELLHSEKCTGCHDSSLYTRENRKVSSKARLNTQVNFCKDNLGIMWFDEEVTDVVEYLNIQYYRFQP